MPAALVLGGDRPLIMRLIRVSTSPQVGSIHNMGVWKKAAVTWLRVDVRQILDPGAAARRQYQVRVPSLHNGGRIVEPQIVVGRCLVFLCILRCYMAIRRLQVGFGEALLEALPKENAKAVQ